MADGANVRAWLVGVCVSWFAVAVAAIGLVWIVVCVLAYIVDVLRGDRL